MSYPMVHLSAAWLILNETPGIQAPADFLLGAVAPDAIHYRDAYNSDKKLYSHFGCDNIAEIREKWGYVTENEPWAERVWRAWKACKDLPVRDFLHGYFVHILTDIYNNKTVWTPFRISQGGAFDRAIYNQYGDECRNVDYLLYRRRPARERIWALLRDAQAYGVGDHIAKTEVERLRESILHERFREQKTPDVSGNRYFRWEDVGDFVRKAADFAMESLK